MSRSHQMRMWSPPKKTPRSRPSPQRIRNLQPHVAGRRPTQNLKFNMTMNSSIPRNLAEPSRPPGPTCKPSSLKRDKKQNPNLNLKLSTLLFSRASNPNPMLWRSLSFLICQRHGGLFLHRQPKQTSGNDRRWDSPLRNEELARMEKQSQN